MDGTNHQGALDHPLSGPTRSGDDIDQLAEPRPRFSERPIWRPLSIVAALIGMLGLLALIPATYWRF